MIKFTKYILIVIISVNVCFGGKDSLKFVSEPIKVIGLMTDIYLQDSPSKIIVFDKIRISKTNGDRVSDILKHSSNINIKSYGNNSSLQSVSLNGLGAENTLILINGIKMNSPQNSQFDLSLIPKDGVEKIEIIDNGYGSLYGSDATGGIINIITDTYFIEKKKFDLKTSLNIGSYGYQKYLINIAGSTGKLESKLYLSNEKSKNDFSYYFNNGITKELKHRLNSDYRFSYYSFNLKYNLYVNSYISFYSDYSDNIRNLPGMETGSPPSFSQQTDKNWKNVLKSSFQVGSDIILKANVIYQNNLTKYIDGNLINSYYKNTSLSGNFLFIITRNNFNMNSGLEFTHSKLSSDNISDFEKRIQTGLYINSAITVLKNGLLKIFPSLRYDIYSDVSIKIFSWGLGCNLKPFSDESIILRANTGSNYRIPSLNDLYWNNSGNKYLKPEKSFSYNLGLKYNFKIPVNAYIDFSYSNVMINDRIIWIPVNSFFWSPRNLSNTKTEVITTEVCFNKELFKKFNITLSCNYNYNFSRKINKDYLNDPAVNKQIIYVPLHTLKFNSGLTYKGFSINLFYTAYSRRFTDSDNKNYLPAFDVVDGNITYCFDIKKIKTELKFELNNINDANYQIISGYPMPLRNYKLSINFNY